MYFLLSRDFQDGEYIFIKKEVKPSNTFNHFGLEFFTHKDSYSWYVTEKQTGLKIGSDKRHVTRKDAIKYAVETLNEKGEELTLDNINFYLSKLENNKVIIEKAA